MATLLSGMRFPVGEVVITQGARQVLTVEEVELGLSRHTKGDWGDVCEEDLEQNNEALKHEATLRSRYRTKNGIRFWIITEWDRSVTTILLPMEY